MKLRNILIIIFILLAFITIIILNRKEEKPFNKIELNSSIRVFNNTMPSYYDTIINIGLDQMGLDKGNVVVYKISNEAKNQFNGVLKAHIRYYNGDFYLFIEKLDRNEAVEVIAHEVVHMSQYQSKKLVYDSNTEKIYFDGEEYTLNTEYNDRPWEKEAFSMQGEVKNKILEVLY